jgi:ABC-type branched-subunit amino acid transport system permease subunit
MEMVRAEFKEDLRRTKQVGIAFGVGAVLLGLAGVMLAITCVHLLQHLVPDLPHWACWAIVTGAVMVLGGAALLIGNRILASYNPLPDKSFNALQENVSWVANPPR